MLKPNTKSLQPDRFGKRIICAARIIFAAYIIEAYEGIEKEMELGQKPIYDFCGTVKKKRQSCSRCYLKSSLETLSSSHLQDSIKHCLIAIYKGTEPKIIKSQQRLKESVGVKKKKKKGGKEYEC